jgi:glycosyltransferase 2 family protein
MLKSAAMSSPRAPEAPSPTSPPANRRGLKLAVRLLGPLLLVVVLYRVRREKEALGALLSADILPLLAALALNVANNWLKVLRWDVLLAARGHHYPRMRAWTSFLSSVYVGMLTPGRVGDVLRAQYLKHDLGMPYSEGIAVIVVDRLCDLYVLMAFVAVGVARFSSVVAGDLAVITWAGVVLTALAPLVLLVPGVGQRAMRAIYRKLPGDPSGEGFDRFLAALEAQRFHHLAQAVVLTTLAFGVNYVQGFLLARAMHLNLAFFDVVCLLAIASLLGLLPISVSGVGVRELCFSLIFPALGHSSATGVVYGIGVFFIIYVAVVLMGLVSWNVAPPPVGDGAESSPNVPPNPS